MVLTVPDGIAVSVAEGRITVKGPNGQFERIFNPRIVDVKINGTQVDVSLKGRSSRKNNALLNTTIAHLKNMLAGSTKLFEKKLQILYSHFPVTIEIKGKEILIKNFLGEKTPRKTKIFGNSSVEVKGQEITVSGADKESVGQTAANLVKATKILKKDVRVFQDGIYSG
jgi:large subunit ribosomal protein L6